MAAAIGRAMHRRQPLPSLWMMTDERQGDAIWRALEKMPSGSGVVFRHYRTAPRDRRRLFDHVKSVARRRGLVLVLAGSPKQARAWGADGSHGRGIGISRTRLRTASVHDVREIRVAERGGADLLFLSPVFPTRSHPGSRPLGRVRFGLLARQTRLPVIALGGMNPKRARSLAAFGVHGWAAIDAWND
jgi:thiamine-phosphate pyrophosphorylase